eukprot:6303112-Amphidinium_carterae.1
MLAEVKPLHTATWSQWMRSRTCSCPFAHSYKDTGQELSWTKGGTWTAVLAFLHSTHLLCIDIVILVMKFLPSATGQSKTTRPWMKHLALLADILEQRPPTARLARLHHYSRVLLRMSDKTHSKRQNG